MSERYEGSHRPAPATAGAVVRFRGLLGVAVGLAVGLVAGGGAVYAVAAGDTIACQPGQVIQLDPAGTWACVNKAPTPTPSATQTPSPSPSATPSPSPSVTPTATTPAPTTPPATTPPPSPSPTVTPSPTPTPSPTFVIGPCIPKPSGCGYPDATNTGAKGTLTVVNGSISLITANQVYENKDVRGCIYVNAANVTIRNVKVTCSQFWGIRYDGNQAGRLLIEDTTVVCTGANGNGGGRSIGDQGFTARRVDVSGCADGFNANRDVTIEDSYCHGLPSELDGNGNDNGLHVDCIQGVQTSNVTIRHNTLIAPFYSTSAIGGCCIPGGSVRTNWQILNNLIDGGGYAVYCFRAGTEVNSQVSGNRFGPGGWIGAQGYADDCNDGGLVWSGNVRDATNAVLPAK